MSKQTAVEWLYELSKERELDKFDLEQAKEMEKQRMFKFAIWYSGMEENKVEKAYERYLIETFNK